MTCGSVDDGKSTLIGRLLYETGAVPEDQLAALEADSRRWGTRGGAVDFALLLDGLAAEREQGITIDVAWRYFGTARRRFIVADCPGHEQYTRNLVTAASTAELAVLLADARQGLTRQSRRHAYLAAMLGVRQLVLAVNKMDLVDWAEAAFAPIRDGFAAFVASLGLPPPLAIPLAAAEGDNVVSASPRLDWYRGPTLLAHLETVLPEHRLADGPFRLPVQLVQRPDGEFRGLSGTIAGGRVKPGDQVLVTPGGQATRIARLLGPDGPLAAAEAGQAVTVTLVDPLDVGRGDVLAAAEAPGEAADQFAAHLYWMDETPLLPERRYLFRLGHAQVIGRVTELKHRINVDTLEQQAAKRLGANEIAWVSVALDRPVAFDAYAANRQTGGFLMIDRESRRTVAGGTIAFALRRARNLTWQALSVDRATRAALKQQRPCILWFTGLSGAGKSTIANGVEAWLAAHGHHTYLLDGDNVRHGLNRDLGFTDEDRVENVRRVAEVAKLMADAGLIVLVSLISPFRAEREMARAIAQAGEFLEIYVDTPIAVCEARDPKGLYARARSGQIKNFTGIDSAYEPPVAPELALTGAGETPAALAERVIALLKERQVLG